MSGEEPHDLMQELDLLAAGEIELYLNQFSELFLRRPGEEPTGPLVARLSFPLSYGDEFISLSKNSGEEIGIIRRLSELDRESQGVVRQELEWRHFSTRITAIHAIDVKHYVPHWDVETERGRRVFEMRSRRDLRMLGSSRVLLRDADGNRYEIRDLRDLDGASRQLIDAQL